MKYRHGDVGIQPVKAPPRRGRTRLDHLTLAEGEVTGHSHRLIDAERAQFKTEVRTAPAWMDDDGEVIGERAYEVTFPTGDLFPADAELYLSDGQLYARVRKKAALVHQEHGTIILSRGTYRIIQQREWSPLGERRVID